MKLFTALMALLMVSTAFAEIISTEELEELEATEEEAAELAQAVAAQSGPTPLLIKMVGLNEKGEPSMPSSICVIADSAHVMVNLDKDKDGYTTSTQKMKEQKWANLDEIKEKIKESLESDLEVLSEPKKPHAPQVRYVVTQQEMITTKVGETELTLPGEPKQELIYERGASHQARKNDAAKWLIELADKLCTNEKSLAELSPQDPFLGTP